MEKLNDLAYGKHPSQVFDLYWKAGTTLPAPLIVYIHGGGWVTGSEEGEDFKVSLPFIDHGYGVATIRYRLDVQFWDQMLDLKQAIAFLKGYPEVFDTKRIHFMGQSAGGHFSMMLALQAGVSCRSVISVCGPTDLTQLDFVLSVNPGLLKAVFGGDDVITLKLFSPISYVRPGVPEHLLITGIYDQAVPLESICTFYDAMKSAGNVVHAFPVVTPDNDPNLGHTPFTGIFPRPDELTAKIINILDSQS